MDTILIIEDEEPIRLSIAEYLELEGYKCLLAKNGEEGIELAVKHLPDLIISDIKMPGINGHEVLQELRKKDKTSDIPFIFLSALVDKKHLREGMLLGADDYITKPFQPEELLAVVKVRLDRYKETKRRVELVKDNLSLSLPHELKTPLVAILGYSEILMDKHKDSFDHESFEFAKAIHNAGIRLNRLIQQFIIYEKLSFMESNPKSVEATELTDITAELVRTISVKTAERYDREKDLLTELVDGKARVPLQLYSRIIDELIDNAFKFSKEGSQVLIKTENNEQRFSLLIRDNGRGMTTEQIESISAYKQFEREKYEQQGIGLGLTIAKKITTIYNGEFNFTSEPGKGTTVIIKFKST